MQLTGKKIIVTGGGQGIGLATAKQCQKSGAQVFIFDNDVEQLDYLEKHINENDRPAIRFIKCDVSDPDGLKTNLDQLLVQENHKIDTLVNNAGANPNPADILNTTESDWDTIFSTNVHSIYLLSKIVIPHMKETSNIINIGSILGVVGAKNCSAYSASKAAIVSLTKSMALDYGPKIRVNCVCPGAIETRMLHEYLGRCEDPVAEKNRIIEGIPMKRLGKPEDVSNLVLFLMSKEASWITGGIFVIDGGDSV